MSVECDRMWVSSRWVWKGNDSKSPKVPNPEYHPPILFHHDVKTGNAYFTDEAGRLLDLEQVPEYIRQDIEDNPVHVVPQFAPPNLRQAYTDPVTGQEFKPGQDVYRDSLQGVPLLNEARSTDIIAKENKQLMEQNKMLQERLEALEAAKATRKPGRPKGSRNKTKAA